MTAATPEANAWPVDSREAKLPHWAKYSLARARREAAEARAALAAVTNNSPTNVVVDPYAEKFGNRGRTHQYIVASQTIRFAISDDPNQGDAREAYDYIDVFLEPGGLKVIASNTVLIQPHVSNSITIGLAR